jgi:hypothetical protein
VAASQISMIKDQRIKIAAGARMGAVMMFLLAIF